MAADARPEQALAAWFDGAQTLTPVPLGSGHINDTWLVAVAGDRWVLQRINGAVFPDPAGIAAKVTRVVAHLHEFSADARTAAVTVPRLRPTLSGNAWHQNDAGVWRLWEYLAPARTLEPLDNPRQAEAAGRAFGAFQSALTGLFSPGAGGAEIADPIPGFMQLDHYLRELDHAVARSGRLSEAVEAALGVVESRRDLAAAFAQRSRVIHGDCKVDNLLFRPDRDEVLAIIDLDTVMYGHWAWDFGDLVRSAAADGEVCNVERFAAVSRGFAAAAAVQAEVDALLLAPRYVGLMLGVRFLADHLDGDRYFKVAAPGDNLARARRQLALVQDMERQETAMRQALGRA